MREDARKRDVHRLELGRDLIVRFAALLKAVGIYDAENDALGAVCQKITATVSELLEGGVDLEVAVRQDSIYVGGQRVRESLVASSSYQRVADILRAAGIASFQIDESVPGRDLQLFAKIIMEVVRGTREAGDLVSELKIRGATSIEITPAGEAEEAPETDSREIAQRIYLRSIGVVKGVFHELTSTNRVSARRVKRAVQEMIESIDGDPDYLMNLSTLKNYDEYTFNHSVNVSILAIAMGRHIGLSRRHLYVLGQAGMLHDLGKLCIPKEILNKPGRLLPEERSIIGCHPVDGFISISSQLGVSSDNMEVALAAYEHHLNEDGTGYPQSGTSHEKGFLSQIVSIVDRYDAMTSARVYRGEPFLPPKALAILFHTKLTHHDPLLLRYFMNMMGYYPLGTVTHLTDGSVAVVVGAARDADLRHMPTVRLILDADGSPAADLTVDLASTAKESEPLQIAGVLDGADYGIEPMDYIL